MSGKILDCNFKEEKIICQLKQQYKDGIIYYELLIFFSLIAKARLADHC